MFLVSRLIDACARMGGPRLAYDIYLRRQLRWRRVEPEWLLLPQLVDRRRAAVDIGGNAGLYAGRLAQLCREVHCFEPIPELVAALKEKLPTRVAIHQLALSDAPGAAVLRIPLAEAGEMDGLSTLEAANTLDGHAAFRRVDCRLERLHAVLAMPVGFIKIDVEGHEHAVLRGADGILARDRPVLLVESQASTNPAAPGNVFALLQGHGYQGHFLEGSELHGIAAFDAARHQDPAATGRPYINNFIFTPPAFDLAPLRAAAARLAG